LKITIKINQYNKNKYITNNIHLISSSFFSLISLNLDDLGSVQGVLRLDVVSQAAGGCLSQLQPLSTDNGGIIGIHLALADASGLASSRV